MHKLTFDVQNISFSDEIPDEHFATAEILAFSSGKTKNDTFSTAETIEKTAESIYFKPVLYELKYSDFGTHPRNPLIAGFIVPNSAKFIDREDGEKSLVVQAKIWKYYASQFVEIFKRDGGNKKVSIEMDVLKADKRDDLLYIESFSYVGVCVLGDYVSEASPGANINFISFAQEQAEKLKKELVIEFQRYSGVDFTIPEKVKREVKSALENKEFGTLSSTSMADAKHLINSIQTTAKRIKRMYSRSKNNVSTPIYMWLGGDAGFSWMKEITEKMEEEDKRKVSLFADSLQKEGKEEINFMEKDKEEEVVMEEVENPEEDKPEEEGAKSEEPREEQDMSLDAFADVAGFLATLEKETESIREENRMSVSMAIEELRKGDMCNYAVVAKGIFAVLAEKTEKLSEVEKEFSDKTSEFSEKEKGFSEKLMEYQEKLRKFEDGEKEGQIAETMAQVMGIIPEKEMESLKNETVNYSLEDIGTWKNKILACAFAHSKSVIDTNKNVDKIGLPFTSALKEKNDSIWNKLED